MLGFILKRTVQGILIVMALLNGFDATTDIVNGEIPQIQEIYEQPDITPDNGENGVGASVKSLVCGGLLFMVILVNGMGVDSKKFSSKTQGGITDASSIYQYQTETKEFDKSRAITPQTTETLDKNYIETAFNKSEDGLHTLIYYVCNKLGIVSLVIEQVKVSLDHATDKLVVSVKGSLGEDDFGKLDELIDLVGNIVVEKIEKAATKNVLKTNDGFVKSLDEDIKKEIKEGPMALLQALGKRNNDHSAT